jgi:HK97 family phage major capsid protein
MEASTILRNSADFAKHYASGDKTAVDYDLADYCRGVANLRTTPSVKNALSTGTDAAGGYAVPNVLMPGILDALVPASALLKAGAGIVPLAEGAKTFNQAVTASIPTAAWRSESGTVATSDPAFRSVTVTPRSLSFMFKISRELLSDGVGIDAALRRAIAQSFAKELDRVALYGSGVAPEPRGIKVDPVVQKVSFGANGSALANYKPLVSLLGAVLAVNAPMPTALIMNPGAWETLNALTDTKGQPVNMPKVLEPVKMLTTTTVSSNLVVGSSGAVCTDIFAGDFTQMYYAMRESISIQLLKELYAGTGELAFVCHVRADVVIPYPQAFALNTGLIV